MDYLEKLASSIRRSRSVICAGIDPVPELFPDEIKNTASSEYEQVVTYCRRLIEQTKAGVAAYKFNVAYFEALGRDAYHILDDVLESVPSGKIIIADAKRGDVPHTSERYKAAFFDRFGFDAITLSPFMGTDTLEPYLRDKERAIYALTLTSNPGAGQFMLQPFGGEPSMSMYIAKLLAETNANHPGTVGMVIGATQDEQYMPVMKSNPKAPLLIPGIGAQGGSVEKLAVALDTHQGQPLINASRSLSAFQSALDTPWDTQVSANTTKMQEAFMPITEKVLR
ncbi:orotidine-5'-phosphate decarboxylase [Balneolaceae bacterium ANBcel3]|nr:orotidine-5'-phosphate decarboxylase [Balneolaceae bacterium ANBcel3]